jgi:hypothetical protein
MDRRGGGFEKVIKYSFYISIAAFLLFILLAFLHFTTIPIFSFTGVGGIIPIPVPTMQEIAFEKVKAASDLSCNFTHVQPSAYTISFEVVLNGEFLTTTVPRVLLYRSAAPIILKATDDMSAIDNLMKASNIVVYVDPLKNDLYVSVLDSSQVQKRITSKPLENIPLRTPFRIALVVSDTFLEIYMNGEFVQTLPYPTGIMDNPDVSYIFSTPAIVKQTVQVGAINLWSYEMSAKAIRNFSKQPLTSGGLV